jgi:hypothetical protein
MAIHSLHGCDGHTNLSHRHLSILSQAGVSLLASLNMIMDPPGSLFVRFHPLQEFLPISLATMKERDKWEKERKESRRRRAESDRIHGRRRRSTGEEISNHSVSEEEEDEEEEFEMFSRTRELRFFYPYFVDQEFICVIRFE